MIIFLSMLQRHKKCTIKEQKMGEGGRQKARKCILGKRRHWKERLSPQHSALHQNKHTTPSFFFFLRHLKSNQFGALKIPHRNTKMQLDRTDDKPESAVMHQRCIRKRNESISSTCPLAKNECGFESCLSLCLRWFSVCLLYESGSVPA